MKKTLLSLLSVALFIFVFICAFEGYQQIDYYDKLSHDLAFNRKIDGLLLGISAYAREKYGAEAASIEAKTKEEIEANSQTREIYRQRKLAAIEAITWISLSILCFCLSIYLFSKNNSDLFAFGKSKAVEY